MKKLDYKISALLQPFKKFWNWLVHALYPCCYFFAQKLYQYLEKFWSWLVKILYPYRYFFYIADVILIILLVVLFIRNII